jgi:hypothetical protein
MLHISSLRAFLKNEWQSLCTIQKVDQPWQRPFAAALSVGMPSLIGALFGRMDYGLIASLGGQTFFYLPEIPMPHRMMQLFAAAFAMTACYALGQISHFLPATAILALALIAIVATMTCRFYRVNRGAIYFTMVAAISAFSPSELPEIPLKIGLFTLGCLLACAIAFLYSLIILRRRPAQPVTPPPPATFDFVVFDSIIIGSFVGLSLSIAYFCQLERTYWVSISCLVIISGMNVRAMWVKDVHRLLGTGIGLLLAWGILSLPLSVWSITLALVTLCFLKESLMMRHYLSAVTFITPLAILLADAATLDPNDITPLIEARFYDTLLGCLTGFVGGLCLFNARFRAVVGNWVRALLPARFRNTP